MSGAKSYRKLSVTKLSSNFREAVQIFSLPLKDPSPEEVVLKVIYVGINASDIVVSAGGWSSGGGRTPFDVGLEALGEIVAVGSNVGSNCRVGQNALWLSFTNRRAYTEYIYAAQEEVIIVPGLRPEYLALMVSGLSASIACDHFAQIKANETVLVTAAAGGLGHLTVQWAKSVRKGQVIAFCSNQEKVQFLEDMGCCDLIVNYKDQDYSQILRERYPEGVDVVWETVGSALFKTLARHVAPRGRMVSLGTIATYKEPELAMDVGLPKDFHSQGRKLIAFSVSNQQKHFQEYFNRLYSMYSSGQLKVVCDYGQATNDGPFEGLLGIVRAVEYLQSGQSYGKVVAKVQPQ